MSWKTPLSDLDFGPEEEAAVLRVLRSGWLTMGEETQAFEAEFARFLGVKHALACSSGTAALHLALQALEVGHGSTVIQPAVNFVAAANMTVACGATPVFADICALDEPTISPEAIDALLAPNERQGSARPAAVIVMHYGGYPCRMDAILDICRTRGVPVIEDACHAPGGRFADTTTNPRSLGALGDIGCFSFFSNKNIATGEGGMAVTDRDDLATAIRALRSHGMTTLTWDRHRGHAATYDVLRHGFNYRIDELRSALGREQLRKLEAGNRRRRNLTAHYWQTLAPLEDRGWLFPFKAQYYPAQLNDSACHLMTAVAPSRDIRWEVADALRDSGIQTSLHYPIVPGFAAFADDSVQQVSSLSVEFCARTLTLPLYPTLSEMQVGEVARIMNTTSVRP